MNSSGRKKPPGKTSSLWQGCDNPSEAQSPEQVIEGICDNLHELARRGYQFGTVYADPPWAYTNRAARGAAENHYRTLSLTAIESLPVGPILAKNAHLHLWTTAAFLFDAERVVRAWGFEPKSSFVWVKPTIACGNYWRLAHEFLILGVRGRASFRDKSQRSWQLFPRSRHSAKPEPIRAIIEKVSPGPYLELFGRKPAPGWVVFGNRIERGLFDLDIPQLTTQHRDQH
jgi:N6-adenosine-specific RNA methylase IME4